MSYQSIPKKLRHKFNSLFIKKWPIKKYGFKIITNFNEQQISNLEKRDISIISNTLEENHDILSFFKYKLFNQ
jgi:hypothetical protein